MNQYNLDELDDNEPLRGRDLKFVVRMLGKVLAENEEIKNELINLNDPYPLMTKGEAAEFLRVTERHITNMVNRGDIIEYHLGKKSVRYKRKDLEAALVRKDLKLFDPKKFKYWFGRNVTLIVTPMILLVNVNNKKAP